MRPAFTTIFLLLLIPLTGFCQTTRQIVVCDSQSREGIPYAVALFYKSDALLGGLYSDTTGRISLSIPYKTDNLLLSCVGYKSKTILLPENLDDTIKLDPVNILFAEIVVHPRKNMNQITELGYAENCSRRAFGDYKNNILAVFVENTCNREMLITKLLYTIRQETKQKTIFRVHLYAAGTNPKTPGRELVTSNSFFYVNRIHNSHAISFDVSALKIVMPLDGIFIGLEWIGFADDKSDRTPNSKYGFVGAMLTHWQNEQLSLRKNMFKNGKWEYLPKGIENGNMVQNLAFGVKVVNL